MSLFRKNKKEEKHTMPKSQNLSANQVSDDDLLSIAGGQDFHSEAEERSFMANTEKVLNKYQ